jgi:hypothetical protein
MARKAEEADHVQHGVPGSGAISFGCCRGEFGKKANVDGRAPFQLQTIVVTNRDAKYCHVSHNAQHQA